MHDSDVVDLKGMHPEGNKTNLRLVMKTQRRETLGSLQVQICCDLQDQKYEEHTRIMLRSEVGSSGRDLGDQKHEEDAWILLRAGPL